MALNTVKCNHLMSLRFKGLKIVKVTLVITIALELVAYEHQ